MPGLGTVPLSRATWSPIINFQLDRFVTKQKKTSPATGFLIMGAFNAVGALALGIIYFPYSSAGGANSHYMLIAAAVLGLSSIVLFKLYGHFRQKLDVLGK